MCICCPRIAISVVLFWFELKSLYSTFDTTIFISLHPLAALSAVARQDGLVVMWLDGMLGDDPREMCWILHYFVYFVPVFRKDENSRCFLRGTYEQLGASQSRSMTSNLNHQKW